MLSQRKQRERRKEVKYVNEKKGGDLEGRGSSRLQYTATCDKTRLIDLFLMKRKESCARRRGGGAGGEKEGVRDG